MTDIHDPYSQKTAASAGQQSPNQGSPGGEANSSDPHVDQQIGTVPARFVPEGGDAAGATEHADTFKECSVAAATPPPTGVTECESPASNDGRVTAAVAVRSVEDGVPPLDTT